MDTLIVLQEARTLITPRRSWARARFRQPVLRSGGVEYKYCALGAVTEVAKTHGYHSAPRAVHQALHNALPQYARQWQVMGYNDTLGHRMTLRLFDRAIRNVKREQALKRRQDAFSQAVALAARREAARARTAAEEELVVAGD